MCRCDRLACGYGTFLHFNTIGYPQERPYALVVREPEMGLSPHTTVEP